MYDIKKKMRARMRAEGTLSLERDEFDKLVEKIERDNDPTIKDEKDILIEQICKSYTILGNSLPDYNGTSPTKNELSEILNLLKQYLNCVI